MVLLSHPLVLRFIEGQGRSVVISAPGGDRFGRASVSSWQQKQGFLTQSGGMSRPEGSSTPMFCPQAGILYESPWFQCNKASGGWGSDYPMNARGLKMAIPTYPWQIFL